MSRYLAAIDQGTTSTRCIVFDRAGAIVAQAQQEHRQLTPHPGWVEHDPDALLANTIAVAGAALARAGIVAADLAAIGLSNQRETTVLWDRRTGRPLANAIVWMDTRTEALVRQHAADGGQDRFRTRTGLPLSTYFSGLKLAWLLDHVPGARAAAERGEALFGTVDSWLAWWLTGGPAGGLHVTDVTNASRTQLMDLATCAWDPSLLDAFGVPPACLPRIVSSSAVLGKIALAPLAGVRLAGILGDQQAALVGQTCFAPGEAKNTYGTGAFLMMNTGAAPVASRAGLLTTLAYRFGDAPPCYALEGAIAITGALVQWLRDNLRMIDTAPEIEALAREVPDNGDVYIVPAFSGLYAPYWKSTARGVIAGLTGFATRAHIARAALEATAYQVRDVVEAMASDSGITLAALQTDGGMAANDLLMQFQADILAAPVVRPRVIETTALGAAYAAGLAVGVWPNPEALRANAAVERVFTPAMGEADRARYYRSWQKAVQRSFDWAQ
ncbi:MAG: glycerol kinase GlpK [Proteobacteria bacterium]|nr:glycerol kinase GlpK [Pseudomonadota bacterium]